MCVGNSMYICGNLNDRTAVQMADVLGSSGAVK